VYEARAYAVVVIAAVSLCKLKERRKRMRGIRKSRRLNAAI
jgi:hypothetical protein